MKLLNKKKHLIINTIKLFCEEGQQYALSCLKTLKISRAIVEVTLEVLSVAKILSASIIKRLVVEQSRILKREWRVRSWKFQGNSKLQGFILQLRVANYKLSIQLQFSIKLPSQTLKLQVGKVFDVLNFQTVCYQKLWELLRTKLKQLTNTIPGFELSVSIITMPQKSHFTMFAIQKFVQYTKKHRWILFTLLEWCF